jgi:hypothetical protein
MVLGSFDYSGQESRIAAVLSRDPAMVEAHLAPKKLVTEDGIEYVNPAADLHLLTCATGSHAHLVANQPKHMWYTILTQVLPGEKKDPRSIGKTINFAMQYLSSAASISERNHVKLEVAEKWVKSHMETYPGYYIWAEEYGNIAAARGFALIPFTNNKRWVLEERSGGRDGDSAIRSSVNAAIQSSAAYQTKKSMILIQQAIDNGNLPDAQIVGQCHDEILLYYPGKSTINWEKSEVKNGLYTSLKFEEDEQAKETKIKVLEIMEKVQTDMFRALGSEIKGACSGSIAPIWAH